jgi:hypothetical protein
MSNPRNEAEMTVLPELERMLVLQASRRASTTPALAGEGASHPRRPRLRVGRRWGALALVGVVLGTTAVASKGPWDPSVGRQSTGYPTLSFTKPSSSTLSRLGVLRRAQTTTDRDSQTQALLRLVGGRLKGVRPLYVRNVEPQLGPGAVTLVSAERRQGQLGASSAADGQETVCLLYPLLDSGEVGERGRCWSVPEVIAGSAYGSMRNQSVTHVYGLVPDGVATVAIDLASGRRVLATVHDNFFDVKQPAFRGKPVRSVRWLDAAGRPLGPPAAAVAGDGR